jgi:hypothetical protein
MSRKLEDVEEVAGWQCVVDSDCNLRIDEAKSCEVEAFED